MKIFFTVCITVVSLLLSCESRDLFNKLKDKTAEISIVSLASGTPSLTASTSTTLQYDAYYNFPDGSSANITSIATWTITGNASPGGTPGSVVTGTTGGTAYISASYNGITSASGNINVLSGIFVSPSGNDSTGTGKTDNPYATILYAISVAVSGDRINVAQGTYDSITLSVDGVSIYGGYASDWTYDIVNNKATISDMSDTGSAINCTNSITASTIIEGFIINGSTTGAAASTSAVTTSGYAVIRYCNLNGGYSSGSSYGILSNSSGTFTIENCNINGGTGPTSNYGIYSTNDLSINSTTINAGSSSNNSYGIYLDAGGSITANNTIINGGNCSSGATYGVYYTSSLNSSFTSSEIYGSVATGTSGNSYGFFSNGSGEISITNSTVSGGLTTGTTSYGISANNSTTGCTIKATSSNINGGSSASLSYGISTMNDGNSIIAYSTIDGGSASSTYGYLHSTSSLTSSSLLIYNSIISGGSGTTYSRAIMLQNNSAPSPYLYNNIILSGTNATGATTSIAIYLGQGSSPVIANNTFSTGNAILNAYCIWPTLGAMPYVYNNIFIMPAGANRYGIYENYTGAEPAELLNNLFYNTTVIYHNYTTTIDWTDITSMESGLNTEGSTMASGNMLTDPLIVGGGDYHLTAGSPAYGNGLNGIDSGWVNFPVNVLSNPIDYDDVVRPAAGGGNWTIGAYQ